MSATSPVRVPAYQLRRQRRRRVVTGLVVGALVVGAGSAGAVALARRDAPTDPCPDGRRTLAVAAPPDLVAVVRKAASAATQAHRADCVDIRVAARTASSVAAALTGQPPVRPDVWVPDSSLWLRRLQSSGVPASGPSIARSPVVLAVPGPASRQVGSAAGPAALGDLLAAAAAGAVRLGLAQGGDDSTTVEDLVALTAAARGRTQGRTELAATLRGAAREATPDGDLVGLASGSRNLVVPASERSVWEHNSRSPASRMTAVYARGAALDYPYVILTDNTARIRAAQSLLTTLGNDRLRAELAAAGFRTPSGTAPTTLSGVPGIDPTAAATAPTPSARDVATALRVSRVVTLGTRMLAVLDVSGSMAQTLPGAVGASRIQVTRAAATNGLSLYPDDASIGLWVFARDLTATTDYRQLVPLGPLGTRPDGVLGRERLGRALAGVDVVRGRGTALYDTTLAAVRTVLRGWDPNRVNSVVLLTDGRNADARGLSLDALLKALRAEKDPRRPVPVITIGLGPDSDHAALAAISRQTGGSTYQALRASDIYRVFQEAMGRRECLPTC